MATTTTGLYQAQTARKRASNTFCQKRYNWQTCSLPSVADGRYHTYTMEWRTELKSVAGIQDNQVIEHGGFW